MHLFASWRKNDSIFWADGSVAGITSAAKLLRSLVKIEDKKLNLLLQSFASVKRGSKMEFLLRIGCVGIQILISS